MAEEQKPEQCEHFVTEGGKCISCGSPFDAPRWTMEDLEKALKDADCTSEYNRMYTNSAEAQQIIAIAKLAEDTWKEYDERAEANEDPQVPQRPRLRMIGGRLVRIPFYTIWKEVVQPAFLKAKELGYLGDYSKWCDEVKRTCRD